MSTNPLSLNSPELLRTEALIGGRWKKKAATFPVYNPADGSLLASVTDCSSEDVEMAILTADKALKEWKGLSAQQRQSYMDKWYYLIVEHSKDLARIMTLEQGKPLAESWAEVQYGASFIKWFGEEGKRIYGDVIPSPVTGQRIFTLKQPVGVCAAITPWNFPLAMITRKISPALAAGCTVVIKPAEDTPLTALAIAGLAVQAGFPEGVINVVTCLKAEEVGKTLTTHPKVRKISFTGSTEVGRLLMKNAAENIARISLELGGNAPFLVFDDADIDAAVDGAIASKYRNAGQTCICANRILVQQSIYNRFVQAYTSRVEELKVGNGTESGVKIGPLINEAGVSKVERLVEDAVTRGARLRTGGSRFKSDSLFFRPTVIDGVTEEMDIHREEIFGPVSAIYAFGTEEEGIAMANNTVYGLASYFYARDMSRIWRVSEGLEYGMVGVNTGSISTAVAPFGGIKQSGVGREGSKYGIEEYVELKYVAIAG